MQTGSSNKFCKRFCCVWLIYFGTSLSCFIFGLSLYLLILTITNYQSTNRQINDLTNSKILVLPCPQICDYLYSDEYLSTQCCVDSFTHDDCEDKRTCADIKLARYEADLVNQYDNMYMAGGFSLTSFLIAALLIFKRKHEQRRWNRQDRNQRRLLRANFLNHRANKNHTFDQLQSFKHSDKENPCAICYQSYTDKKAVKLNCEHMYHRACIKDWMAIQDTCPICRAPNET